jgi:hypothetical protein
MIIGGVAASLLGQPRLTADIDATVILDDALIDRFFDLALAEGLTPRISNPAAFARRSAMLLLKHDSSGIPVDVAQSRLPFERAATLRATRFQVAGFSVPLPTPEDLIIMKAIAHRPQDLEDIRGITLGQPHLSVALIHKAVREFARALEMPELWTDIAGILKRKSSVRISRRQRR